MEEVTRAKLQGLKINLVTVQDILDKKFVLRQELRREKEKKAIQKEELELW